ncbi:MAG: hypothetical protein NZM44_02170 [Candidatus Calescibacterium sp.]|nr:hypothetical protein [Candidatus Calescibacterium sp.]
MNKLFIIFLSLIIISNLGATKNKCYKNYSYKSYNKSTYYYEKFKNYCKYYGNYGDYYKDYYYSHRCRIRPLLIWDSFSGRYYPMSSFSFSSSYYNTYYSYRSYIYNYYNSHYDPYILYGSGIKITIPTESYYYDHKTNEFKKSTY